MEAEEVAAAAVSSVGVYAVPLGEEARRRAFALLTELRRAGLSADMAYGSRGLKGVHEGGVQVGGQIRADHR